MPVTQVLLYTQHTTRGQMSAFENIGFDSSVTDYKDAVTVNGLVISAPNPISQSASVFMEKRPGLISSGAYESGSLGTTSFTSSATGTLYGGFANGTTKSLRSGSGASGLIGTPDSGHDITIITECPNPTIAASSSVLLVATDGIGRYYHSQDVSNANLTFTGTTTSGSPIVTGVAGAGAGSNLMSGQRVSGTGIPANTRILSVDLATQITMNANATASGSITITRESLAKIMDSDFPSSPVGPMIEMDGYIFQAADNKIHNSDLSSVTAWTSGNYMPYNTRAGQLCGVGRIRQYLLGFGTAGIEVYRNQGNPSGSPLVRIPEGFISYGPLGGSSITYPKFCFNRDMIFFACNTIRAGTSGVWMMGNDLTPKKISTPIVDRILIGAFFASTVMSCFDMWGHTFLHIGSSSTSSNATLPSMFYCVESGEWSQASFPFNAHFSGGYYAPTCVSLNNTGGKVYTWGNYQGTQSYADDSTAFTHKFVSENISLNNGKPFTVKSFRLLGDNQSGGTIALRTNTKDYDPGSWLSVGTFDKTDLSKPIYRGGYYRNRIVVELTDSHDSASRLQALLVDWEPAG